ncbi:hypothetical protein L3X38_018695 [Prunus dulcis]|uniref:Uncharacterized protein n=1 Tax=Prunus dulcis TaxID=3755 RepID=A0AAD4W9P3_PRUDU|nr:hypothetical protein L3X38_018695 [Prunus dulcis]
MAVSSTQPAVAARCRELVLGLGYDEILGARRSTMEVTPGGLAVEVDDRGSELEERDRRRRVFYEDSQRWVFYEDSQRWVFCTVLQLRVEIEIVRRDLVRAFEWHTLGVTPRVVGQKQVVGSLLGSEDRDASDHIDNFLDMCGTQKIQSVSNEFITLRFVRDQIFQFKQGRGEPLFQA